ncbi:transmembrane protein 186-like [Patiria miniata]|uniref:Transmembrane protein 186 n=1 Tax=Patiria miniata TaxID=46514 RepID=A0A914BQ52_PATMI|nr:transmembrane protein 186-like [Patiria miniata]
MSRLRLNSTNFIKFVTLQYKMFATLRRLNTSTHRLALGFLHHSVASESPHTTRWVQICMFHQQSSHISTTGGNAGLLSRNICSTFPAVFQAQQPAKSHSSSGAQVEKTTSLDDGKSNNCEKEYTTVYCFPGMRYLRVISRFKLAQTFFTMGIAPPMWYLHTVGLITEYQLLYSLSVATFALVMLYSMSFFLRRIIGFIYLHRNRDSIKIAHMNFWGRRRDQTIPLFDVIPIGETGERTSEILIRLRRYSTKEKLYFSLKYGMITHQENFCEIFGDFDSLTKSSNK